MINNRKAAYVIQEIRNIPFYEMLIQEHEKELKESDQRKEDIASLKSPQGHEDIGAGRQFSTDSVQDRMVALFDYDDETNRKIERLKLRRRIAEGYKSELEENADDDFVRDYFSGDYTMQDIEKRHNISNAYDKMIRTIRNNVESLKI